MNHCVIETDLFVEGCELAGLSRDEVHRIISQYAENPTLGAAIPGTGGARKHRFPLGNKGKRSGVRVISYYGGDDVPVFLLDVYSKAQKIDLTEGEKKILKRTLSTIAENYRESVKVVVARFAESA